MWDNKYFRFIGVICIGCLLFTTACTKYSSTSAMAGHNAIPEIHEPLKKVEYSDSKLKVLRELEQAVADLDNTDLLSRDRVGMTLLCKAIQLHREDLLERFLDHIKINDKKYDYCQVIHAICTGIQYNALWLKPGKSSVTNSSLLVRAVDEGICLGNMRMVGLLVKMLMHYYCKTDFCKQEFYRILRKKFNTAIGESLLVHITVALMDLDTLHLLLSAYEYYPTFISSGTSNSLMVRVSDLTPFMHRFIPSISPNSPNYSKYAKILLNLPCVPESASRILKSLEYEYGYKLNNPRNRVLYGLICESCRSCSALFDPACNGRSSTVLDELLKEYFKRGGYTYERELEELDRDKLFHRDVPDTDPSSYVGLPDEGSFDIDPSGQAPSDGEVDDLNSCVNDEECDENDLRMRFDYMIRDVFRRLVACPNTEWAIKTLDQLYGGSGSYTIPRRMVSNEELTPGLIVLFAKSAAYFKRKRKNKELENVNFLGKYKEPKIMKVDNGKGNGNGGNQCPIQYMSGSTNYRLSVSRSRGK